ncbi:hypothetical protein LX36DRAFT_714874 [Colletotrichum falcatum]|nr:hypothetical protein LX36DRAFT_714874 [Colletotrichum falcatum]
MKTLIINALTAGLVAGVAEACSSYTMCRCTTANNAIDNNATELACVHMNLEAPPSGRGFVFGADDSGTTWCSFMGLSPAQIDNCEMREACAFVNATGPDSWCEKH